MTAVAQERIYSRDLRGLARTLEALSEHSPYMLREQIVMLREVANYLEDLLE